MGTTSIACGRDRIDEIDGQVIRLIQDRLTTSRAIQAARQQAGGPRIVHSREIEIVSRWTAALGDGGRQIALSLLELSRGSTPE